MIKENGGPAFPVDVLYEQDGQKHRLVADGISMRDYFAANATDADVSFYMYERVPVESCFSVGIKVVRTREQAKYAYADAMLEARK